MYGFLPCSKSVPGHLFLILVYEYLLFHGESYVASGGQRIFKILGPGVFGACAFQIIGSLPEALILLVTVLFTSYISKPSRKILLINMARVFEETDQDRDKSLDVPELREFLRDINFRKLYSDKDKATEDMLKDFDMDNNNKINVDEFVKGMEKWIEESKKDGIKTFRANEVLQPWIEKKKEEREMMKNLIPEILEHLQSYVHGSLLTEDGTPDLLAIKRLFKDIDLDKDDFISYSELKDLMTNIKYGIIPNDTDAAASKMMEELDISGDHLINEDEFIIGLSKWLNTAYVNQTPIPIPSERNDIDYHKSWEQTDELVEKKFIDKSIIAWIKALSLVVLGIAMLGGLAEPLIHSVQNLSTAANIPSFFIAFIFVPFATNARIAVSAIAEARRKKINITSLTFSELYGTVLMNNLLGFSVLLSLIYFRGLSWNFSVEVLMVLSVTGIIGCLGSFSTVFPVWTSILAYLLYPLSLVLVTVFGDFKWLS
ncbi:hypothetical protein RD792_006733 [Penstemon davidsonii]|uniref:EF-hand domain-containing protein n=1 Tax=Penstemon davidsonii TaxID=160366 RepID=A0ABR0DBN6_9LAMI|nr:hypothetical protein RD792_006733 [Penstemon davidsonii]